MTNESNYLAQLQASSTALRLSIPGTIADAVVDKIETIQTRTELILPDSIAYVRSIPGNSYFSTKHMGRVRLGGWQLEIIQASKDKGSLPTLLILIKKIGTTGQSTESSEHRNGNNPLRNRARRR